MKKNPITKEFSQPIKIGEYLTTRELSLLIKMSEGTIRNLVYKKVFIESIHYIKPTPKKLLFIRSAIEAWLHRNSSNLQTDNLSADARIHI
jgi:hypothetical protein